MVYYVSRLDRLLDRITDNAQRHAWLVLAMAFSLAIACLWYVKENIRFNTDTARMISDRLQWRQDYEDFKGTFPQYKDNIVIVIDGLTPDLTQDASLKLADALRDADELFIEIFEPELSDFLRNHQLLFLELEELQDLADHLATVQPFLALLTNDPTLRGLFDTLREGIVSGDQRDFIDLAEAFQQIDQAIAAHQQGRYEPLSWQRLMTAEPVEPEQLRTALITRPRLDFSELLPAEAHMEHIRQVARDLQLTPEHGVRVRLTGSAALEHEQLQSVITGTQRAAGLALIMVTVFLLWGLRSVWLAIATLLSLIFGLIYTAGFATAAVGELNLISIAFAILYIGLGVDFAIHYVLRYQEDLVTQSKESAIHIAGVQVGRSLVLCAITTAIGFYAFVPTDYSGVAELGVISGTGMFISLCVSITVLPALLSLRRIARPKAGRLHAEGVLDLPARFPGWIVGIAVVICVVAALALPDLRFDHNPLNLQNPQDESVQTFRELLAEAERSPYSLSVLAADEAEVQHLKQALPKLSSVDAVMAIDDFLPENQEAKLQIIDDLALLLGPDLEYDPAAATPAEVVASVERLRAALAELTGRAADQRLATAAQALRTTLERELDALAALEPARQAERLDSLKRVLLGGLAGRLNLLADGLNAGPVALEDIPPAIYGRWVSDEGEYAVEVYPVGNLNDNEALELFVDDVHTVAPHATDSPVINVKATKAVVSAFRQAFVSALSVIALLLLILLPHKRDVPVVLIPLLVAGLTTCGVCAMADIDFNFANIIALPLLLGVGVDSSIHILHRYRTEHQRQDTLLTTSTARAVVFSALTTICSFGNLAVSPHAGTASMGLVLAIGVATTIVCTLLLLPALLTLTKVPAS